MVSGIRFSPATSARLRVASPIFRDIMRRDIMRRALIFRDIMRRAATQHLLCERVRLRPRSPLIEESPPVLSIVSIFVVLPLEVVCLVHILSFPCEDARVKDDRRLTVSRLSSNGPGQQSVISGIGSNPLFPRKGRATPSDKSQRSARFS